jgi:hypothetical protein
LRYKDTYWSDLALLKVLLELFRSLFSNLEHSQYPFPLQLVMVSIVRLAETFKYKKCSAASQALLTIGVFYLGIVQHDLPVQFRHGFRCAEHRMTRMDMTG